ncbi:MAG: polyprenyl synthetase family protein, partial [Smithellaceae bacterium]|nr:polyprenyl synthetase family protein [Smithellaceae bacterium]
FIHTATLLHDDVVDEADLRRGRTAARNIWGNAATVLVGDFLLSRSFLMMAEVGEMAVMNLMATTTGTMSEGEVFQLIKRGDAGLTEKAYLSIVEKKTAILISAACAIGGILGKANARQIEALTHFGMRIGSAFQITDDTLDYTAQEDEFGKSIGKDLDEGKITLPLIHALKKCTSAERAMIKKTIAEPDEKSIEKIKDLIARYGGIDYALTKARGYVEDGKDYLSSFPESPARDSLLTIADYIIARKT